MKVSDILRVKGGTLFTVHPDEPLARAVDAMAEKDIGSLVVMDHGRLVGILTFREVLAALATRGGTLGDLRVSQICEHDPLICAPGLDLTSLRGVMLERHARYVPVMSGHTLEGVVSFHDVAKAVYEEQSYENRMLKSYIGDSPAATA